MPSTHVSNSPLERLLSMRVRPLVLFCALFVIIALGVMMINSVQHDTAAMQARVTSLRIARDQLYKEHSKLQNEVKVIQTDDYIIAKARELYGYMMPNELLFVIKNPEALYGSEDPIQMYVVEDLP